MKTFKVKSLKPYLTDEQVDRGATTVSFLSFERAIRESEEYNGLKRDIKGFRVTEQGIEIILND